jgi:hypothetical protein
MLTSGVVPFHDNVCPHTAARISASIRAVSTLRSSLSMYVFFFVYNKKFSPQLLVLLTAHRMLLSEDSDFSS